MKKLIVIGVLLVCFKANAQKFYVEKTDNGYEKAVIEKLLENKYQITFLKDSSNYTVMCLIGKTGMGRATGSLVIVDTKTGQLVEKSKETNGQTAIWNSYANPRMLAVQKASDKYLLSMISDLIKK